MIIHTAKLAAEEPRAMNCDEPSIIVNSRQQGGVQCSSDVLHYKYEFGYLIKMPFTRQACRETSQGMNLLRWVWLLSWDNAY